MALSEGRRLRVGEGGVEVAVAGLDLEEEYAPAPIPSEKE